jgi:hypothetical protein
VSAVNAARSPLVLTEQIEHLDDLAKQLSTKVPNLILLRGGRSKKELETALRQISEIPVTEARVVLATGKIRRRRF